MTEENTTSREAQKEEKKENVAMFVSPEAPAFRVRLEAGKIQFENGVFKTDNPKIIKELEHLMQVNAGIKRYVKRVSLEKGLAAVEAHKNSLRKAGISGPLTSQHLNEMRKADTMQRDEVLRNLADDPAKAQALDEALDHGNMMVTEPGITNPPEIVQPPVQPEDKPKENTPQNVFANLANNSGK